VFIYNSDKDPLERGIINLSVAQIVYNEEQIEMLQVIVFLYGNELDLKFKP